MRTIEDCIKDLVCDIENFIGGNITERQNELIQEILEIHKAEESQELDSCEDAISRQAAMGTLKNLYHTFSDSVPEHPEVTINRALERIKILPSVNHALNMAESEENITVASVKK